MTCNLAYSINGKQPVTCTYISDQPLQYFDDEWKDVAELVIDEYIDVIGYEDTVALIKSMAERIK